MEVIRKGVELFRVELSRMEIGEILCSETGQFYSVGWGQEPAVRAVRVFCGWNLAVRGLQGEGPGH